MIPFEHFPEDKKCPICGQNTDSPCFLMPLDGTDKGSICQALPTHVSCVNDSVDRMRISSDKTVVYFFV